MAALRLPNPATSPRSRGVNASARPFSQRPWPAPDNLCSRWKQGVHGVSFLGMEGGQQQHANKHNNCDCQRKKYCSHHVIRNDIDSHGLIIAFLAASLSLERSRFRCKQQGGAGVHKGRTRVRFTREGYEILGELVRAFPRFDLRKGDGFRLGVR